MLAREYAYGRQALAERSAVALFVGSVKSRYRLYGALALLVLLAALAAGWILAEVVCDRIVVLQMHQRAFLLYTLAAVLACAATAAALVLAARSRSNLLVASWIERRYPQLANGLISILELWRKKELGAGESDVAGLIGRRVAGELQELDPEPVVELRPLRVALKVLGAACAACLLYAVVSWSTVWVSLTRVLFPWERIPAATSTRLIAVEPGDARRLRNEPVTIRVRLTGTPPGSATLHVSEDGANFLPLALSREAEAPPEPGGWWRREVPGLNASVRYQITAGDTRSDIYTLTVVDPPLITSVRARVEPPEYSGLAAFTSESGSVSALAGSAVTVLARTNRPPETDSDGAPQAELVLGPRRLRMSRTADGLAAEVVLDRTVSYHVEFTDELGYKSLNPVTYVLTAIADEPPRISLAGARTEEELPPWGSAAFRAAASDDYGLAAVSLRYQVDLGPWQTRALRELRGRRSAEIDGEMDLSALKLAPGATVVWFLTARDTRRPEPNSSDSDRRTVKVRAPRGGEAAPEPPRETEARPERPQGAAAAAPGAADSSAAAAGSSGNGALERLADALRKLAQKLGESPAAASGGDSAASIEELARALERLAEELESGSAAPGGGAKGDEYAGVDLPADEPPETAGGAKAAGESGGTKGDSGEAGGAGTKTGAQAAGSTGSAGAAGAPGAGGSSGGARASGAGGQGSSGRSGGGARPGSGGLSGGGGGSGGGATSGGPAAKGSGGGGDGAGAAAGGRGETVSGDLRRIARGLHEAADEVRRGSSAEASAKRVERASEELSGWGRRLKEGELDSLAERALRSQRESPAGAARGELKAGADRSVAPEGEPAAGRPGPDERAPSQLVLPGKDARRTESGATQDDLSRLSPEFRRLYEAYTRAISE